MAAKVAHQTTMPDMRAYTSDRVFDGVRQLDDDAKGRHAVRLKKALAKRRAKKA